MPADVGVPAVTAGAAASVDFVSGAVAAVFSGAGCEHPKVTNAASAANEYVSDFVITKFTLWNRSNSRDIVFRRGVVSELVEGARLEIV